jgi:hypothetical protein
MAAGVVIFVAAILVLSGVKILNEYRMLIEEKPGAHLPAQEHVLPLGVGN